MGSGLLDIASFPLHDFNTKSSTDCRQTNHMHYWALLWLSLTASFISLVLWLKKQASLATDTILPAGTRGRNGLQIFKQTYISGGLQVLASLCHVLHYIKQNMCITWKITCGDEDHSSVRFATLVLWPWNRCIAMDKACTTSIPRVHKCLNVHVVNEYIVMLIVPVIAASHSQWS